MANTPSFADRTAAQAMATARAEAAAQAKSQQETIRRAQEEATRAIGASVGPSPQRGSTGLAQNAIVQEKTGIASQKQATLDAAARAQAQLHQRLSSEASALAVGRALSGRSVQVSSQPGIQRNRDNDNRIAEVRRRAMEVAAARAAAESGSAPSSASGELDPAEADRLQQQAAVAKRGAEVARQRAAAEKEKSSGKSQSKPRK